MILFSFLLFAASAPVAAEQSALEQQLWSRMPEQDRPRPQEQEAASIVLRALTITNDEEQLSLLRQARSKLLQPTRFRGTVVCAEAGALGRLQRFVEAEPLVAECLQLRPGDPRALGLSASLKMMRPDPSDGVRELMAAIARDPRIVSDADGDDFDIVFRKLAYVGRTDLAAEFLQVLAGTGWGRDDPSRASRLAVTLARNLILAGKTTEATQLLPRVLDPSTALQLIVDRRFDPIRDAIHEWSNGTLELQRNAFVDAAESAFSIAPDMRHRLRYAWALQTAGRPQEAVKLLQPAIRDPAQWGSTEEDYYYVSMSAIRLASAMRQAGQTSQSIDELVQAEQRLRQKSPSYARNIIPNLVRYLIKDHRPDEALALLDTRTPKADEVESPSALGHYEALRICARKQKGERVDEAVTEFHKRFEHNSLVMDTLTSCISDPVLAKQRLLDMLKEDDQRGDVLVAWQIMQFGVSNPNLEETGALLRVAGKDPELLRAIASEARQAPASYRSAFAGWSIGS